MDGEYLWGIRRHRRAEGRLDRPGTTESYTGGKKKFCSLMGKQNDLWALKGPVKRTCSQRFSGPGHLEASEHEVRGLAIPASVQPPAGRSERRTVCSYTAMHRGQNNVSDDLEAGREQKSEPRMCLPVAEKGQPRLETRPERVKIRSRRISPKPPS